MTYQRTPGLPAQLPVDSLTVGEIVPARDQITSVTTVSHASGTLALCFFTADKTETIATLTTYSGSTAAGATPTICRMGIYSIAANGDGTLIASTPNDTALWAATNTAYPKALSASFGKVAGQRYATAVILVTAAALPTFLGPTGVATTPMSTLNLLAPTRVARITGQSDLPSSFTAAGLTGYQLRTAMLLS